MVINVYLLGKKKPSVKHVVEKDRNNFYWVLLYVISLFISLLLERLLLEMFLSI